MTELVLQSGARLIFTKPARDYTRNKLLHSFAGDYTWFGNYTFFNAEVAWSWFDSTREQAIRDAVVINLGIEPQDEVYLAVKRLVGPKQSTFLTADYLQVEKRLLAYYYGMSAERFREEYEQDWSAFPGSVTGRFSSGRDSNLYDGIKYLDPDADGLRRRRFEGVRSVTGRLPSQDPAQSPPVRKNQSRFRKLPPLD